MILQQTIQRKLSELLGAEVSFEKLKPSLLGGSIEAVGVRVGDLLTVGRTVAKVAIGRAFKGEIVVTSLTIERPVVKLVWGKPLPLKAKPAKPQAADGASAEDEEHRWSFDIEKVLVVDAEVQITADGGYRASVEKLLVELKRNGNAYEVTLLANSVGRRDRAIELGELRGKATIMAAEADLAQVMWAAGGRHNRSGEFHHADRAHAGSFAAAILDVSFDGKIDL